MLLFRYFGSHALETLQDCHLKAATVSSLNDPFELLYQLTGTMTVAKAKRHLKQRIKSDQFFTVAQLHNPTIRTKKDLKKFVAAKRDTIVNNLVTNFPGLRAENFLENTSDRLLRIVCFSASTVDRFDEILIWSHYANKHKGIRIGFEFPDGIKFPFKIVPIQYRQERVALDLTRGSEAEWVKEALGESIRVKSLAWKYEQEFRMLAATPYCINKPIEAGGNADFVSFKKEWVKYVDLGVRTSSSDIQTMKGFLQKEYPNVLLRRAVFHPTDYALEYQSS